MSILTMAWLSPRRPRSISVTMASEMPRSSAVGVDSACSTSSITAATFLFLSAAAPSTSSRSLLLRLRASTTATPTAAATTTAVPTAAAFPITAAPPSLPPIDPGARDLHRIPLLDPRLWRSARSSLPPSSLRPRRRKEDESH
ncbi:Os05g0522250 [Oryza sativa Japonica Group]|uniref:Os05g0522250 protein n=1 Tax=Oryza sativa subsp. japonica TaxID=39947 RepID=A0A0N7KL40_ORYSJ|nr:hypothetical protein EE612_030698 [Oryza sativa]BAS94953.1 Os05g0522250 [Oryza sativa Japonica Group]